jgi:hypothetical protein
MFHVQDVTTTSALGQFDQSFDHNMGLTSGFSMVSDEWDNQCHQFIKLQQIEVFKGFEQT